MIAQRIAPFAARFGLERGDGVLLLNELLGLAGQGDREAIIGEARVA